jgi:hypothetical protein
MRTMLEETICVRCDRETHRLIYNIAESEDKPASEVIRKLLIDGIRAHNRRVSRRVGRSQAINPGLE